MNPKHFLLSLCLALWAMAAGAQHNPIFNGGAEDGTALRQLQDTTHNAIFNGGQEDGNALAVFTPAENNDIFSGGADDGSDKSGFAAQENNSIFAGGKDEGSDLGVFAHISSNGIFAGGKDDGYDVYHAVHHPVSEPKDEEERRRVGAELLGFEAWEEDGIVKSEWVVSGEFNLDEYIVEKSQDKFSITEAGRIASLNVGENIQVYQLTDALPYSGTSFYRLKSVDQDGKTGFSPWIEIEIMTPQAGFSLNDYPNPVQGRLNLNLYSDEDRQLSIQLFDLLGHSIEIAQNQALVRGQFQSGIELGHLPDGVYILRVLDPATGEQISRKIQKVKP